jgi:hypothetical protein
LRRLRACGACGACIACGACVACGARIACGACGACGVCVACVACSPHAACVPATACVACGACGAALQPSLPRFRCPQLSHRPRRGFRLRRFRRCAAAACIISQCASPCLRWNGGCVLGRVEACMRALTNRV